MSRLIWNNPVLLRELQERVLSRRTVIIITLWTGLLCLITGLYYASEATNTFSDGFDNDVLRLANVGQNMFDWLLFFMIGLVLFLVPGITAASIAGERERQTLLPMQVTLLRPIDIVVGKILASLVFVLVLIAVTMPVLAFAYVIGGVTIAEVFTSLGILVFSATAIACMTVACSALVRRVPAAIVTAYGLVLLLTVGSLALYGVASVVDENRGFDQDRPPLAMLAVNPVVALAQVGDSAVQDPFFFNGADTPMAALRELVADNRRRSGVFVQGGFFVEGDRGVMVEPAIPVPAPPPPVPVPTPAPAPPTDEIEGALDSFIDPATLDLEPVPVPEEVVAAEAAQTAIVFAQPVPEPLPEPDQPGQDQDDGMSFVLQYLIAMTFISGVAVWDATRHVRTPAQVER